MAKDSGDAILHLNNDITKGLRTPEDIVDKDVKAYELSAGPKRVVVKTPIAFPCAGTEITMFIGPTGSAKTSTIFAVAGAKKTLTKLGSDTKIPTLYRVKPKGRECWALDTAGMCDSVAENEDNHDKEELLIDVVIVVLEKYGLKLKRNYLTIGYGNKLPPTMNLVWPKFQMSLGIPAFEFQKLTGFLVTMANTSTEDMREDLQEALDSKDPQSFFPPLKETTRELWWKDIIICGENNFDALKDDLLSSGFSMPVKKTSIACLKRKQRRLADAQQAIAIIKSQQKVTEAHLGQFKGNLGEVSIRLQQARSDLSKADSCAEEEKKKFEKMIADFEEQIKTVQKMKAGTENEKKQKHEAEKKLLESVDTTLAEIQEMEGLGGFFKKLIVGGVKIVGTVAMAAASGPLAFATSGLTRGYGA